MKLKKSLKTIMLAGSILAIGAVASTVVVSCSNTKVPQVTNNIELKIGTSSFNRSSGVLQCTTGYVVDGETFKTSPGYDTKDPKAIKNKASNQFSAIDAASTYIQSYGLSILTIIQNLYSSKVYSDVLGLSFSSCESIASFYYEGEAGGVVRAGLKSIEIASADFSALEDATKDTNVDITFSGIKYTYAKWKSTNGENIIWQDELGSLTFASPITLTMKPVFNGDNWTGQYVLDTSSTGLKIAGADPKEFTDTLNGLRNSIDGNILHTTLASYCKDNKDKVISTLASFGIS